MAIYLPYSLLPMLIFDLLDAMATMGEIWGMGIHFCDSPCLLEDCLHIWELMIRLRRRRADPFSLIFGSETGDCVLGTIL